MRKKEKILFFIFFSGTTLFFSALVLAQGQLEINYPNIPGVTRPQSILTPLNTYLGYLYGFFMIIAGVLTFSLLVVGGIKYLLSFGKPQKMADAKEQITGALLGMLIIFLSYLIINTLNPQLALPRLPFFPVPTTTPVGIYLETPRLPTLALQEVPVGTLITSEIGPSSFLLATSTSATSSTSTKYATAFEGALYGERLKRIHEVASTTVPVAKKLREIAKELRNLVDQCSCFNCQNTGATCITPNCAGSCPCTGDVCPPNIRQQIKDKQKEIELFSGAYEAFLNSHSLVEDYKNNHQADITTYLDQEAQDLIDLMIEVENKGTRYLDTDPPERDVMTNILHLELMAKGLKDVRMALNPRHPYGCQDQPMSRAQRYQLEQVVGKDYVEISPYKIIQVGGLGVLEVEVIEDPATFYCPKDSWRSSPPFSFRSNFAFAKETIQLPKGPAPLCDSIVEIPIGKALDEAIKLTNDILRELTLGIYTSSEALITNARLMKTLTDDSVLKCEGTCFSACIAVPDPLVPGSCISGCTTCFGFPSLPTDLADNLLDQWLSNIEGAFKRLNSEKPIGEDGCCKDPSQECRRVIYHPGADQPYTLQDIPGRVDKRKYTLKEKLAEIQKLLNLSRDFNVYASLIYNLIDLNTATSVLATSTEVDNIETEARLNLSNCNTLYFQYQKLKERRESAKFLEDCQTAKEFKHIRKEVCSPDPPYNCGYFNASTTPKTSNTHPNCYCFDEDFYPKLANDFFCCLKK
jgi:hypothetical protein